MIGKKLDPKIPEGPIHEKWDNHRFQLKLVSPANRRKYHIIVIGTGLAGASASASLGELGYNVTTFCIQDSPRRAHSISAQGGINAAKNYANDGDSIWRLFYDTIKGGDYRSREACVYRLAQISNAIIDHCVAQGVPFARDYAGYLANRSFGGAQVSRTFYARGQTGQQLLLGCYQALMRQKHNGQVKIRPHREVVDIVIINGRARGVLVRNSLTGEMEKYVADALIMATGGYSNAYYLSTNSLTSNGALISKAYKKGALWANPSFVQIHPTCIPVSGDHQSKLTLMSESLRNDGRIWAHKQKAEKRHSGDIPEEDRDYYLERIYPSFGNLVPRDVASRNAKFICDDGLGVGRSKMAVYLDFQETIRREGIDSLKGQYENLFEMYQRITGEDPYQTPMRIYPAVHYTMGGLWVDYNLMSTIPGLFVLGEANFSDHGANRLGAQALMQGLADGNFIIPYTVSDYLAGEQLEKVSIDHRAFEQSLKGIKKNISKLMNIRGERTVDSIHRELGKVMWDYVGISRNEASLNMALKLISKIKKEFSSNVLIPGKGHDLNGELQKALRLQETLDIGELMGRDALDRKESCGCHFREESQTKENEAKRDDKHFSHVSVWEHGGDKVSPQKHIEKLTFEHIKITDREYK